MFDNVGNKTITTLIKGLAETKKTECKVEEMSSQCSPSPHQQPAFPNVKILYRKQGNH